MKKTRQDNDLIDHIGAVYVEKYTKLFGPTRPGVAYTKIRHDNDLTNHIDVVYVEKETKLSWPIGPCAICDRLYRCSLHKKLNWYVR